MGSGYNGPLPTSRSSDDDSDVRWTTDTVRTGQNCHFHEPRDANRNLEIFIHAN